MNINDSLSVTLYEHENLGEIVLLEIVNAKEVFDFSYRLGEARVSLRLSKESAANLVLALEKLRVVKRKEHSMAV